MLLSFWFRDYHAQPNADAINGGIRQQGHTSLKYLFDPATGTRI